jgi:EpsD family peptidyl-prolyl cis-trans isomerase
MGPARGEGRIASACLGLLVASLWGLAACGSVDRSAGADQVVAKVNDREITVTQLNQALQSVNPIAPTPEQTKETIDSLIDEELLVQAALKIKLDQDPATMAAFERARRQILVQTYAQRVLYPKKSIALAEQQKYYKDNPALFANRKLYHLTVYSVQQSDVTAALTADLNSVHSSDEVRAVLEKHEIKFETRQLNSAAEDLPMEKLSEFAGAEVGDLLIAQQMDGKMLLISIVGLENRSLPFERAKAEIDEYLTKTAHARAVEERLKVEKAVAKISYVGAFSPSDTSGQMQLNAHAE